jgi:2-amino-4-hydroxy-6-hydroxymethyldihydropteridine diphosphokinase
MLKSKLNNSEKVMIGLGSNVGDKRKNMSLALQLIEAQVGHIQKCSSLYETDPWGMEEQAVFLNQVIAVDTDKNPWQILSEISKIETILNKNKKVHWGPRAIDLDILLYGQKIIFENSLIIPHPFMHLRNFVIVPLNEIAPDIVHPLLGKAFSDLMAICEDKTKVNQLVDNQEPFEKGK